MAFDLRPAQIEARFSVFVVCDSEEEGGRRRGGGEEVGEDPIFC